MVNPQYKHSKSSQMGGAWVPTTWTGMNLYFETKMSFLGLNQHPIFLWIIFFTDMHIYRVWFILYAHFTFYNLSYTLFLCSGWPKNDKEHLGSWNRWCSHLPSTIGWASLPMVVFDQEASALQTKYTDPTLSTLFIQIYQSPKQKTRYKILQKTLLKTWKCLSSLTIDHEKSTSLSNQTIQQPV